MLIGSRDIYELTFMVVITKGDPMLPDVCIFVDPTLRIWDLVFLLSGSLVWSHYKIIRLFHYIEYVIRKVNMEDQDVPSFKRQESFIFFPTISFQNQSFGANH